MHGGEDPPLALLTLAPGGASGLAWALVDAGFGVLTFAALSDALPAVEERQVAAVVVQGSDSEVAEALRALRRVAPDLPLAMAGGRPGAGAHDADLVVAPPYEAAALAAAIGPLVSRQHGHAH